MKYIFILIVFFLCCLSGYAISKKFFKRKKFFDSLILLANKISLEINFSRGRLKVLLEHFDDLNKKNLLGIDKAFLEYLDNQTTLNNDDFFKEANILKQEEKDSVLLFFKTLGRSDVENQTKEIQTFVSRFDEMKNNCEIEQKKYGVLALKLGIVAGLFFVVVLF